MKIIVYTIDDPSVQQLMAQDADLKPLFESVGPCRVVGFDDPFLCLVFMILNQQVSATLAETVFQRLLQAGIKTPAVWLNQSVESMRLLGVPPFKTRYIQALAHATKTPWFKNIDQLDTATIVTHLRAIKGIGPWTIEMFLMFYRLDEDVFSLGDLGLRNALKSVLNEPNMTVQAMQQRSEQWRPYRSIVAHYLWHVYDQGVR